MVFLKNIKLVVPEHSDIFAISQLFTECALVLISSRGIGSLREFVSNVTLRVELNKLSETHKTLLVDNNHNIYLVN